MKSYTLKFRIIDRINFNELKAGLKSIETRAATDKYKNIQKGDQLVIVCGKDKVTKTVKQVRHFKSIGALLKIVPLSKIMPGTTLVEARKRWHIFPDYKEKIKKYGIMAMWL